MNKPLRSASLLCTLAVLLLAPAASHAVSVAYVAEGSLWVSSLDGAQKAKLSGPVTNANGEVEPWIDVAQADNGRIVGVRNFPGRQSTFSTFRAWETDGTSTVQGPLTAKSGFATYTYPLSFDLTPNGVAMVYGFSNSGFCCPQSFDFGTYVRNVGDPTLTAPQRLDGENPTLFGTRVVSHSGNVINRQDAADSTPYFGGSSGWIDASGVQGRIGRTDVSADGRLAAFSVRESLNDPVPSGKVGVLAVQGVDLSPTFPAAVDCFIPAAGVAEEPSLSQNASHLAWTDDRGLWVAGAPTTAADPCVFSSAPVLIDPRGRSASIGAADVSAFLPPVVAPPTTSPPGPSSSGTTPPPPAQGGPPSSTSSAAPVVPAVAPFRATALRVAGGVPVRVIARRAGPVTVVATVPARTLGRRGKAVTVARGSARAKKAGPLTVRLKATAAGRKVLRRLKGKKLTLRVTQAGRTTTRTTTLR